MRVFHVLLRRFLPSQPHAQQQRQGHRERDRKGSRRISIGIRRAAKGRRESINVVINLVEKKRGGAMVCGTWGAVVAITPTAMSATAVAVAPSCSSRSRAHSRVAVAAAAGRSCRGCASCWVVAERRGSRRGVEAVVDSVGERGSGVGDEGWRRRRGGVVTASLRGQRAAARWRRRRLGGEMDWSMLHLIDTAPFRGVCQAPSHGPVSRDSVVPMSFFGYGKAKLPEVVQAGDPVLHEPAEEVKREEIGSARVEKTINDMVDVMRNAPGVGLAAPQIGVPLQIIVLEDTKELMSYTSVEECEAQQRAAFDLLVIINPKVTKKENSGTAVFFEGCLSVEGYRALVERHLEVEVKGLGRDGQPLHFTATGWKARILQHEFDHLQGTLYVDQMVKRTFRTTQNLRLPLPSGCARPGACLSPSCT